MLQIESHQTQPLAAAPPHSPPAYRHPRSSKCLLDTVFRLFSEWHKHSKSPLQALHKKGKTLLPGDELRNMKVSRAQNSSIWTYLLWNHLYYGNCAVLNNNNSNNKKTPHHHVTNSQASPTVDVFLVRSCQMSQRENLWKTIRNRLHYSQGYISLAHSNACVLLLLCIW